LINPFKPVKAAIDPTTIIADITADLPLIRLGYGSFAEYRKCSSFGISSNVYATADKDVEPILANDYSAKPMSEQDVEILIGAAAAVIQQAIKDGLAQFAGMFGPTITGYLTGFGLLASSGGA
jgi:hypothetical protein